ncbi:MAG: hypothetical protein JO197_17845 [Acidobacteria bacterium]|nr:hypothetical protein [Acidobacteriota bacterium]MBV9478968.1 hypothetical protein [Acidobacteriota bacterium]
MTTFAVPASAAEAKAPDPSRHVNYALGMVLGVDDFNQEFAYLAGRDRWLARDAIGYGTLNGLKVTVDSGAKGPRLTVTSGSALTPRGQLVCVKPAQCAYLNDWLAAHDKEIPALVGSPIAGTIELYLTLCYRDCPVDLVPIPGSPCRSEDELMAPSRLVDDFSLELRTAAPNQAEEDLLREFAAGLAQLTFGGGGPYLSVDDFQKALANIVTTSVSSPPSSPLSSPISSPLSASAEVHLDFSALFGMELDPALSADYYRAAFLVWIEDIRPKVHSLCGCGGGCCGGKDGDAPKADECLLLARLEVPVIESAGNWLVDDLGTVTIDESRRPILLHLRMLQELLAGGGASSSTTPHAALVAAGNVSVNANQAPVFGSLAVFFQAANTIRLAFDGYAQPGGAHTYLVRALPQIGPIPNPTVQLDSFVADGILLRVTNGAANVTEPNLRATMFNVEINRLG